MATYMFITGIFTIAGHTIAGRVTGEILLYMFFALPFLLLGLRAGKMVFKGISVTWVKNGIHIFVLMAGVALLI